MCVNVQEGVPFFENKNIWAAYNSWTPLLFVKIKLPILDLYVQIDLVLHVASNVIPY